MLQNEFGTFSLNSKYSIRDLDFWNVAVSHWNFFGLFMFHVVNVSVCSRLSSLECVVVAMWDASSLRHQCHHR